MGEFEEAVDAVLEELRPGEVVSYAWVASEAGYPGAARAVGNVLARSGHGLPWWRVVRSDGRLGAGWRDEQARRLRAEGVAVVDGRVSIDRRPTRS